jgi:Tfp pilus assembly protein PilF
LIAAGVTGLLFGLHPIHVESVAWVAERKDLLCALFYLLSVMAYTKHVTGTMQSAEGAHSEKDNAPSTARKDQKTVFSMHHAFASMVPALFFFALALLSKPMAVSLPVVLLILDWYPFNKIYSLKTFRTALVEKLPFFILSIASSAVTILAQNAAGAIRSVDIIPLSSRVIIAARSLIAYIWKMLAPFELIPLYTYPRDISLFSPNYFLPIIFVAGITLACIIAIKSQKLWISVWGYYVVALIPVLGIVQVGGQAMADRYTYLPGLGPFLVAGLFAAWSWEKLQPLNKRRPAIKFAVAVAAIFIFVSMTYLTVRQIGIWKDDMTLWSYVIEKEPAKVNLAYYMRGQVYQEQGYLEKAMADYNMVNALEPFHFEVYCSRASIFEKMGQPDKAIKDYSMAIAINPRAEEALIRRGILYGKAGQFDKAMEDFNRAIDINPGNPPAYVSRGTAYFRLGQNSKALADFSKAIELDQNYAGVYVNRGSLYLNTGNKEQALSDYRKACSLGNQEGCDALRALQN